MTNDQDRIAGTSPVAVQLVAGKKYAFCMCARSQTQPFCDGSHKGTAFKPHLFIAESSKQEWLCMCKQTGNPPYCDGTHETLERSGSEAPA